GAEEDCRRAVELDSNSSKFSLISLIFGFYFIRYEWEVLQELMVYDRSSRCCRSGTPCITDCVMAELVKLVHKYQEQDICMSDIPTMFFTSGYLTI
ncbi:hypothetical protein MKX03_006099, partial [Papaver bracteatum]